MLLLENEMLTALSGANGYEPASFRNDGLACFINIAIFAGAAIVMARLLQPPHVHDTHEPSPNDSLLILAIQVAKARI